MNRVIFTNSNRTLVELAMLYPAIDHFHGVEYWTDSAGYAREQVWHFGIVRTDDTIEVIDEGGNTADDVTACAYAVFVGDIL